MLSIRAWPRNPWGWILQFHRWKSTKINILYTFVIILYNCYTWNFLKFLSKKFIIVQLRRDKNRTMISLIIVGNRPSISRTGCLVAWNRSSPFLSPFFLPLPFHSTFNRTSFFASISIRRSTVYRFTIFYHLANHYNGQFHRYKHRYTHCILIYFPLRCFSSSQRDWGGKKQRQINR